MLYSFLVDKVAEVLPWWLYCRLQLQNTYTNINFGAINVTVPSNMRAMAMQHVQTLLTKS